MKSSLVLTAATVASMIGEGIVCPMAGNAADWSSTEMHFKVGKLESPFAGGSANTGYVRLQHASGNGIGDVFFFVDFSDDSMSDGFNEREAYGEGYAYFSSAKIFGATYGGIVKDVGVLVGINYDADVGYLSYLPGAYIDWKAPPSFRFLRTQFTAVIDDSSVPQKNGWQIDTQWGYDFQIAKQRFSFEGHWEYTANQRSVLGKQKDWFLAQPQLRWDVGYAVTGKADVVFLGTEYQYWNNKLGTSVDESAFQALAVWRF